MPRKARTPLPEPPADLAEPERDLWQRLATEHVGGASTADLLALRSCVDVSVRLALVKAQLDLDGPTVSGSQGQPRAHPLLGVEAQLRAELAERLQAWENVCFTARPRY